MAVSKAVWLAEWMADEKDYKMVGEMAALMVERMEKW